MKNSKLPATNEAICQLDETTRRDLSNKYRGMVKGPNMEDINELPNTRSTKKDKKENS